MTNLIDLKSKFNINLIKYKFKLLIKYIIQPNLLPYPLFVFLSLKCVTRTFVCIQEAPHFYPAVLKFTFEHPHSYSLAKIFPSTFASYQYGFANFVFSNLNDRSQISNHHFPSIL